MNIVNTMLWMKRNAYQESTIAKVAKLLRHLRRKCNTGKPEEVKLYVSRKPCSDAHKENLIEAYACYMKSINREWEQPFYRRYSKKRKAPKEALIDFISCGNSTLSNKRSLTMPSAEAILFVAARQTRRRNKGCVSEKLRYRLKK